MLRRFLTALALAASVPLFAQPRMAWAELLCGDATGDSQILATDALAILNAAVGLEGECTPLLCDCSGGMDGTTATDALAILQTAVGTVDPADLRCPSVARYWNEQLLAAVRLDTPRPTVHARNLFHLSVAMWDAWVAYDDRTTAVPYVAAEQPTASADVDRARAEAISYAAYRILKQRFERSPNAVVTLAALDAAMRALGYAAGTTTTVGDDPAAVGNRIGAAVLAFGATDGANEAADYEDTTGYEPVNEPLYPALSGTDMAFPNRWQPLSLEFFVTQNGIPEPITVQPFITPHWDAVTPFALVRPPGGGLYIDPGLPPQLGGAGDAAFKSAVLEVLRYSSYLDPDDGALIDISPGALGNNPLGTNDGSGWSVNPITGEPYAPNLVRRGDYGRVLAEFWADGPDSETPPGHWNVLANQVSEHPLFEKRIGGSGPAVDDLEWDVKMYLALNGAVHDAGIVAWGLKEAYDYARPISMIRFMGQRGQSSDPGGPAYDPLGLPLEDGLVELVTFETTAPGERHARLRGREGEIAVYAWGGNPEVPHDAYTGAEWILASDWLPYQRETFVTPAFPGFISGHSTFSRAGAEVLTALTGSPYFPGGIGQHLAPAGDALEFEWGPSEPILLQWAAYQDAADEAGISRLWGGIHVPADDFAGRIAGHDIGAAAFARALQYFGQPLP